jgi:N-acetylglucosaminyl-diphospho-decaprenol L-rhamnosyltransferase
MSIYKDVTILIVTFVPNLRLLKEKIALYKKFKLIIVDTSPDYYKVINGIDLDNNVEVIKIDNNGQGFANNVGIKSAKTKYVLYVDLDADIDLKKIHVLYKIAIEKDSWSILIPNSNYKSIVNKNFIQIDNCEASIFFINRKIVIRDDMFDEQIFFYFEEYDYFSRLNQTNFKVYLLPNLHVSHNQGSSVDKTLVKNVSNIQQWHYLWSMYYVYKKKTGSLNALKIVTPYIIKDIIKLIFYMVTFKIALANKRFHRLSGAISSIIGKKSFKRPKI